MPESIETDKGDVTDEIDVSTNAPVNQEPSTQPHSNLGTNITLSGCGGTVSIAGLALIAALGTCTVFVAKKKDE